MRQGQSSRRMGTEHAALGQSKLYPNASESKVIASIDSRGSRDGISAGLHAWRSGRCLAQWVRVIW
jgi:hypothetical protein